MKKITSPMVAIGAILSLSIFAPTTVCAQQVSMQSPGLPQYSQTTGSYYQGGASAAAARAQQAYPQAYPYPTQAPQSYPAAAPQNQLQQNSPIQQGYPAQQSYSAQQGYPAQQGFPIQQSTPAQQSYYEQSQNYSSQERTSIQGAESPAYQAAETPYEAQERALQQSKMLDQVDSGQSKVDTPSGEAMQHPEESSPASVRGKVSKTGLSGAMRTAGRIVGRTALVALPVTGIILLTRAAATSGMPMMAPGMGMMPRMGFGGFPGTGFGMPGMGVPMGMGFPNLMNGLR